MDGQATVKYGLGLVGTNSQPRPAGSPRAGTITVIGGRAEVRAATTTDLRVLAAGRADLAIRIDVSIDHVEKFPPGWEPVFHLPAPLRSLEVGSDRGAVVVRALFGRAVPVADALRRLADGLLPRARAAGVGRPDVSLLAGPHTAPLARAAAVRVVADGAEERTTVRDHDIVVAGPGQAVSGAACVTVRVEDGVLQREGVCRAVADPWVHGARGRDIVPDGAAARLVWENGPPARWRLEGAGAPLLAEARGVDDLDEAVVRALRPVPAVAWSDPPPTRAAAALLVRLAATGVPVAVERLPEQFGVWVGPQTRSAVTEPWSADDDQVVREARSVRQRRAALIEHAWDRALWTVTGLPGLAPPPVSAVLVTRRPDLAAATLTRVAGGHYPNLEIVLALHGEKESDALRDAVEAAGCPVHLMTFDAGVPFGETLAAATAATSGTLVTKVDDDDVYGPWHMWDLVLAREISGAEIVGKPPRHVYIAPVKTTVQLGH